MKGKKMKGKMKGVLLIAVFILSTIAIAIPVNAAQITIDEPTSNESLWTLDTGVTLTDLKAKVGSYSAFIAGDNQVVEVPGLVVNNLNIRLGDITTLSYWSYLIDTSHIMSQDVVIVLLVDVDYDGIWDDYLIGEPYLFATGDGSGYTPVYETWTKIDALDEDFLFWDIASGPTRDPDAIKNLQWYIDNNDGGGLTDQRKIDLVPGIISDGFDITEDSIVTDIWLEAGGPFQDNQEVYADDLTVNDVVFPVEYVNVVYYDDEMTVSGSEVTSGNEVGIYWDTPQAWDGEMGLLTTTLANPDGTYEAVINIPEAIQGPHYIWVKDLVTGYTDMSGVIFVKPLIEFSPSSGLKDDPIAISGYGFSGIENNEVTLTFNGLTLVTIPATIETNSLGSFTGEFKVPDLGMADYVVTALDGSGFTAEDDFAIGAVITLEPEEGPTGTKVTISGRGFTETLDTPVEVKLDSTIVFEVNPILTLADGTFEGEFIVPTKAVGTYTVSATDGAESAEASFDVTGTTGITLTPMSGEPSSEVTIEGVNFTAIPDTAVTIDFGIVTGYKTFYTNDTGGFKETFTAPPLTQAAHLVVAEDEYLLTDSEYFQIAITFASISPIEGPTGTQAAMLGLGFSGTTANVTFGTTLVLEDVSVSALAVGLPFTMPTLPVGIYTVTIEDSLGLIATTSFEVTDTTELILAPSSGPATYEVSIEANYFTAIDATAIPDWYIYNATNSYTLAVTPSLPWTLLDTNSTGSFKGTFAVPDLDLGNYVINATDGNKLYAETSFNIVDVYMDIHPLLIEYEPEDTVNFYVSSTFAFNLDIVITDPIGYVFDPPIECTDPLDWILVGDYWLVPYAASFDIPSNAVEGQWNWTAFDDTLELVNGSFIVGEAPEPQPVLPAETTGEETLDSTGAPATTFAMGDSILASASVENIGTESQTMLIVFQLTDPDHHVIPPNYAGITLPPGLSLAPKLNFQIPTTGYTPGTWTMTVMIIDDWPALGGEMLGAPVTFTFTVD